MWEDRGWGTEESARVGRVLLRLEWEWMTLLGAHVMGDSEGVFQADRIANKKALGDALEKQKPR